MMMLLMLVVSLTVRPEADRITQVDIAGFETLEARLERTRASAAARPSDGRGKVVPGRFSVGFESGASDAVIGWLEDLGADVIRVDSAGSFVVARFPEDPQMLGRLRDLAVRVPSVSYVEPSYRVRACLIPDDPMFWASQWDKWVMYADRAWDMTLGDPNLRVGVVDNGCEYTHPDLYANFRTGELGYDFVGGDADPRPDDPGLPEAFHGTHVSGIIAASINNAVGIAGWAKVQLLAVRALNDSGSGNSDDLASAIRWAADNGCRIVNMSLAADAAPLPVVRACRHAESLGVLLVAAAGNNGVEMVSYPAALPECIAVGATDEFSALASFSNYGEEQEVVAPGVAIMSTATGSRYALADGTSMATPEVTGVAALVMARNPSLSATRVRAILSASAIDMGTAGFDKSFGYGLVCAQRALELAATVQGEVLCATTPARTARAAIAGEITLPEWAESGRLYDGSGRFIRDLRAGSTAPGPGVYFLVARSGGRQEHARLVLAR